MAHKIGKDVLCAIFFENISYLDFKETDQLKNGNYLLFILNIGSTSTKVGIYENEEAVVTRTLRYDSRELEEKYDDIFDQEEMRLDSIRSFLKENQYDLSDFDAIVSRGGIVRPIPSGIVEVNDKYVADAKIYGGFHPVSLGVKIALTLAKSAGIPCYSVDSPSSDEFDDVARLSGLPEIERVSAGHILNQKRIAYLWARDHNRNYRECNLVVAHIGGGISIGAHRAGKIAELSNGTGNEGPFTPERPGSLPTDALIEECYSGRFTEKEMLYKAHHGGGVKAYLGTSDMEEVERRCNEGDKEAILVLEAMCYQIAKEIGAMVAVLRGNVDAILITGGVAYSGMVTDQISGYVKALAPVFVYPGEDELSALASGAMRYFTGEDELMHYE